nr:Dam family site-specific DNA-(adenine-N6)-methyltransferase [Helicobacter himalayensis]
MRSPFFYVGDKYKLMPQLQNLFPQDIDTYIEPFVGGGSSFLNIKAKKYLLNDLDTNLITLHTFLQSQNKEELLKNLLRTIKNYKLSCSLENMIPPLELRLAYKKTYFAKFNKESYMRLRADFNQNKNDMLKLYLLLIYGFNRMLRFNSKGEFNLPVGNVDFNLNVLNALQDYLHFMQYSKVEFFNLDYQKFLENSTLNKKDFIYFDPPYLISNSQYNKLWNENKEKKLYQVLKKLDSQGFKWGLTNLLQHKGQNNRFLEEFARAYKSYTIQSNYISFNDNSIKKDSMEIYISNA